MAVPPLEVKADKRDGVVFKRTSQKHWEKTNLKERKMFLKQKEKESKEATLPLPLSPKTVSVFKKIKTPCLTPPL